MGRVKNETTERYEQLVIPGYLIAKNDTVLAPIAQVTRQPVNGGGCLFIQTDSLCPTIKAFISAASCHRSSNLEAAASSHLFIEVKARATPRPCSNSISRPYGSTTVLPKKNEKAE